MLFIAINQNQDQSTYFSQQENFFGKRNLLVVLSYSLWQRYIFFYIHLKILWRIQNLLNQKIINHISLVLSAISQNVLYRFFSTGIRGFQKKVTFWFSCYIFICICIGFRLFSPPFISIIFFLSKIFIKNHPGFPISKTFRLINKEYYLHERTPNILLWNIEFSNDWKKVLFSFFNIHNLLVTLLP